MLFSFYLDFEKGQLSREPDDKKTFGFTVENMQYIASRRVRVVTTTYVPMYVELVFLVGRFATNKKHV